MPCLTTDDTQNWHSYRENNRHWIVSYKWQKKTILLVEKSGYQPAVVRHRTNLVIAVIKCTFKYVKRKKTITEILFAQRLSEYYVILSCSAQHFHHAHSDFNVKFSDFQNSMRFNEQWRLHVIEALSLIIVSLTFCLPGKAPRVMSASTYPSSSRVTTSEPDPSFHRGEVRSWTSLSAVDLWTVLVWAQ